MDGEAQATLDSQRINCMTEIVTLTTGNFLLFYLFFIWRGGFLILLVSFCGVYKTAYKWSFFFDGAMDIWFDGVVLFCLRLLRGISFTNWTMWYITRFFFVRFLIFCLYLLYLFFDFVFFLKQIFKSAKTKFWIFRFRSVSDIMKILSLSKNISEYLAIEKINEFISVYKVTVHPIDQVQVTIPMVIVYSVTQHLVDDRIIQTSVITIIDHQNQVATLENKTTTVTTMVKIHQLTWLRLMPIYKRKRSVISNYKCFTCDGKIYSSNRRHYVPFLMYLLRLKPFLFIKERPKSYICTR